MGDFLAIDQVEIEGFCEFGGEAEHSTQRGDTIFAEGFELGGGEGGASAQADLALLIDGVGVKDAADDRIEGQRDGGGAGRAELLQDPGVEPSLERFAFGDDEFLTDFDVEVGSIVSPPDEIDGGAGGSVEVDLFGVVELVEEFGGGKAERAEEDGGREFATAIDPDVKDIFGIKFEVDPATAIGDDPSGVKDLAGVSLSFIVFIKDAGRSVKLAYDDAFGAIDDKGSLLGHEGDITEVHFLFGKIIDFFAAGFFLFPDHQADDDTDGGGVGHAALSAFVHIVLGGFEVVGDKVELASIVVVFDGEDAFENGLQPDIFAFVGEDFGLKKLCKGGFLSFNEVGDINALSDLAEVSSDAKVFLNPGRHQTSVTRGSAKAQETQRTKRELRLMRNQDGKRMVGSG